MGLIPIHVYSDVPWTPYATLFQEFGFVSNATKVEGLVDELQNMTVEQLKKREKHIVSLIDSHFSAQGVMQQVERFMAGQKNDLRCQALPPTIRGV